jgi:hypothetical protein
MNAPSSKPAAAARRLAIASAILLAVTAAAAEPAPAAAPALKTADLLGAGVCAEIAVKGRAARVDSSLELLPKHPSAAGIRAAIAAEKPGVIVESAFLLPRQRVEGAAGEAAELASIYGAMRSFGSMQGIEYYSASRKKMRTLYAQSYRIDDEKNRTKLPDQPYPSVGSIPSNETFIVFQEDLSLGANVYRYAFTSFPDAVFVETTNLTRMSYSIVPAVSPGGFRTRVLVIQADDAILFYAASTADVPGFLRTKMGESLSNRAEALFRWFTAQAATFH